MHTEFGLDVAKEKDGFFGAQFYDGHQGRRVGGGSRKTKTGW